MLPVPINIALKQAMVVTVKTFDLNWITEESGFDWLYDYEFQSPRVLTAEKFLTNCEEPSEDFKKFCQNIELGLSVSGLTKNAFLMFIPSKE